MPSQDEPTRTPGYKLRRSSLLRRAGRGVLVSAVLVIGVVSLVSYVFPLAATYDGATSSLGIQVIRGSLHTERRSVDSAGQAGPSSQWQGWGFAFETVYGVGFRPEPIPAIMCDFGGAESRWVEEIIQRNKRQQAGGPVHILRRARLSLWSVLLVLVLLLMVRLTSGWLRRRFRHRRGLCVDCAYDLTGNVSGVCPECGRAITG